MSNVRFDPVPYKSRRSGIGPVLTVQLSSPCDGGYWAESGLAAFGIGALRADVPFPQAVDAMLADLGDPANCAQILIWMKREA